MLVRPFAGHPRLAREVKNYLAEQGLYAYFHHIDEYDENQFSAPRNRFEGVISPVVAGASLFWLCNVLIPETHS